MPGEAQHPGQPGQPARQFRPGCCSPLRPWEQCPPRAGCRQPLGPPHQCAWPTSHPPPRPPPGTAVGARPATPWALEDLPVLILRGPGTLRPGGSESPGSARPGEQAAGIPEQEVGARSVPGVGGAAGTAAGEVRGDFLAPGALRPAPCLPGWPWLLCPGTRQPPCFPEHRSCGLHSPLLPPPAPCPQTTAPPVPGHLPLLHTTPPLLTPSPPPSSGSPRSSPRCLTQIPPAAFHWSSCSVLCELERRCHLSETCLRHSLPAPR